MLFSSMSSDPGNLSYYQISYIWYAAYAVLVATVVGVLVSLATGE